MLRNIKNIGRRNIECQLIYLLFSFSVGIAGMCTYQLNPVAVDKGGFLRYDIDLVNESGLLVCVILSIMAYLLIAVVDKGAHQINVATMKPYNENRVFWSTFIIYSFLLVSVFCKRLLRAWIPSLTIWSLCMAATKRRLFKVLKRK